ncbi:MAG: NADH dehydrogenase [Parcubacteria bacterium OLB19]|nr:MAG: NADH dehydrogenase [Parcubacteria bacterium OLB19]
MFELTIIGGGPAGTAAGVYASRKQLKTLFVTKEWGGQSIVSEEIQNWIGTPAISGAKLAENLKEHLHKYAGDYVTIKDNRLVYNVTKQEDGFLITLDNGETYQSKTVLVASGSKRRQLSALNADKFEHKGLTYCASCDGPIFAGQDVVVIGGGNAAFETAAQLLAYTKSVTLLQRGETYKADPVTVEKVLSHPNMTGITNTEIIEILGDRFVSGISFKDKNSGEIKNLSATGIFVEIGMIPNTGYLENILELDNFKRVTIDPWTQQTKTPGIWAAGDCTNILYHQNNIATGDAVRALEDIYVTLRTK